jgi:hypothetical protein
MFGNKETKKQIMSDFDKTDEIKKSIVINSGNTVEITLNDGTEIIRYHHTNVITKHPNGNYTLNSGGYKTMTTKARINEHVPINLYQEKGLWYFDGKKSFYDGVVVDSEGKIVSAEKNVNVKKIVNLKKQIKDFSLLVLKDMPLPSSGDCFLCRRTTEDKELSGNDHLLSHIKENYLHGSLIVNALKAGGHGDNSIGFYYNVPRLRDQVQQRIYKYLRDRLIVHG